MSFRLTPLPIAAALVFSMSGGVKAQDSIPASQRSARQLVTDYANHDDQAVLEVGMRNCGRRNPRGDSVVAGLLALNATPHQVSYIASAWVGALEVCPTPELEAWFRARTLEARDGVVLLHTATALMLRPTPENIAVVKRVMFDPTLTDEARDMVIQAYSHPLLRTRLDVRGRVDLAAELCEHGVRLPQPWGANTPYYAAYNGEGPYWRARMLEALLKRPDSAAAFDLLVSLREDVRTGPGVNDTVWMGRLREGLRQLERDSRATATVRDMARSVAGELAEKITKR